MGLAANAVGGRCGRAAPDCSTDGGKETFAESLLGVLGACVCVCVKFEHTMEPLSGDSFGAEHVEVARSCENHTNVPTFRRELRLLEPSSSTFFFSCEQRIIQLFLFLL